MSKDERKVVAGQEIRDSFEIKRGQEPGFQEFIDSTFKKWERLDRTAFEMFRARSTANTLRGIEPSPKDADGAYSDALVLEAARERLIEKLKAEPPK